VSLRIAGKLAEKIVVEQVYVAHQERSELSAFRENGGSERHHGALPQRYLNLSNDQTVIKNNRATGGPGRQ
jgi:hypothetical protein